MFAVVAALALVLGASLGAPARGAEAQEPASGPANVYYACYGQAGSNPFLPTEVTTQFGTENGIVLVSALTCFPALKGANGDTLIPTLRCHVFGGTAPNVGIDISSQFEHELNVPLTDPAGLLCVPASQVYNPPGGPPDPLAPQPYYRCFNAPGKDPAGSFTFTIPKAGKGGIGSSEVGLGTLFCATAAKEGQPTFGFPDLRCFDFTWIDPPGSMDLYTQFYPAGDPLNPLPLGAPEYFCVEALKAPPSVGGVAEFADASAGTQSSADSSSGSGLGAAGTLAVVVAGLVVAATLAAAGWIARRRLAD